MLPLTLGRLAAAALAPGRSFELSRLWKKLCSNSCCVCPPFVGLGVPVAGAGDVGVRPAPCVGDNPEVPSVERPVGLPGAAVRPAGARRGAPSVEIGGGPPIPVSISDKARTTFGRSKLLLPRGPTIPAEAPAISAGFRKGPRGSRSDFLEFSS